MERVPVIVTLNATFLAPAPATDLVATAQVLRQGRRLAMTEMSIAPAGHSAACCHGTATYALAAPPQE